MKQQIPPYITELLNHARLAPSVHNTQPWQFEVKNSTIVLNVAQERKLKAGDPTRRELWLSLGICLETLLQAGKGIGVNGNVDSIQTESINHPIASLTFTPLADKAHGTIDLLQKRHSYRGKMEETTIPHTFINTCRQAVQDLPGISIAFTDDRKIVKQIADLTYKGMSLALSSPAFRKELASLVNYNWSSSRIGMHGKTLNRSSIGSIWEKWSIKLGLDIQRKASADRQKVLESSGLIFILSEGDVPSFWLDAGRAYMRVALEITRSGLVQSTLAAPIEASSFHEDIEKSLQTASRIQAMIRIGKASNIYKQPKTTRLSVEELLHSV